MATSFSDQWTVTKPAVSSKGGVVACQNQRAARIGVEVLDAGGNAVDAAVAVSLAMGAVEPWMSGLGGGGAMLVYLAGEQRVHAVDFGMVAPRRLDPADYPVTGSADADLFGWPAVEDDRNLRGPLSVCVPTYLAGIELARERFGTMKLAELAAPAAKLAARGLAIDWYAALVIASAARDLSRYPASAEVWLPGGFAPVADWGGAETFMALGNLARTLEALADGGAASFYRGDIARSIAKDMEALGGRLAAEDLAGYGARILEPLRIGYRGGEIDAMPGLFAGATLQRCIAMLSARKTADMPDTDLYKRYAEALSSAYEERLRTMGDVSPAPSCTTHLNVVDAHGNMVTLTQTLLSLFGSKVVLPETGILMNNGVNWFDPRPGRPNSMAPGKRPLSNMCPVIGLQAGRRFALGASGGRRILPAVLQIASFLMDHDMDLGAAFAQPRIDVSGTDLVSMNAALPEETKAALAESFPTREQRPMVYPLSFACPSAVLRDDATGLSWGAAEPIQPWAGARGQA
ncbi:gamma-glutamyltransferase [Marinimicrococcus flavescens]|uniref:Gamma-glutamyltransferase n=1 Tax=Marinimicrococcus flavescens TaxID=3031815 RepID=A0AAP3UYJ7_9PROT|nr:gamma-glutamyltransferase [Marinimicrococcus flavescens]